MVPVRMADLYEKKSVWKVITTKETRLASQLHKHDWLHGTIDVLFRQINKKKTTKHKNISKMK